jgi:hypothetical protein
MARVIRMFSAANHSKKPWPELGDQGSARVTNSFVRAKSAANQQQLSIHNVNPCRCMRAGAATPVCLM